MILVIIYQKCLRITIAFYKIAQIFLNSPTNSIHMKYLLGLSLFCLEKVTEENIYIHDSCHLL